MFPSLLKAYFPLNSNQARVGGGEFIQEGLIGPNFSGTPEGKQQRKCQSSPEYLQLCLNASQRLAEQKMKARRTILNRCDSSLK